MGPKQCFAMGICPPKPMHWGLGSIWGLGSTLEWVFVLPRPYSGASAGFCNVHPPKALWWDLGRQGARALQWTFVLPRPCRGAKAVRHSGCLCHRRPTVGRGVYRLTDARAQSRAGF